MRILRGFAALLLLILICVSSASALQFSAVDLGQRSATDINDAGLILGSDYGAGQFLLDSRTMQPASIGLPQGAGISAMSPSGTFCLSNGPGSYSVWRQGVTTEVFVEGGYSPAAKAINDLGQIAGRVNYTDYYPNHENSTGFVWSNGITTYLQPLREDWANDVKAIDNSGRVFGTSAQIAVMWDSAGIHQLPMLGGATASEVHAASDSGEWVVGLQFLEHAVGTPTIWRNGVMQTIPDLPALPINQQYWFSGITNDGMVCGWKSEGAAAGPLAAFVWSKSTGYVDLAPFFPQCPYPMYTRGINNNKQIILQAPIDPTRHTAVLLNPVPEPSSLLALGSGLLALGGLIGRRRA